VCVCIDHGVDNLVELMKQMNFPWLLSNIYDVQTGQPLADAKTTHIIEWQGKKVSRHIYLVIVDFYY